MGSGLSNQAAGNFGLLGRELCRFANRAKDDIHASSGSTPPRTSLPWTSARFTALTVAAFRSRGVNFSAPGSLLRTANSAEASSTMLLTLGGLAPFRDQLVDQRRTGFHIPSYKSSCPLRNDFGLAREDSSTTVS